MYYLDCRMLQGSGISTYLIGLIRIYKKNTDLQKTLNYLVKNYSRVISNAPDYLNQYPFKSNIYSLNELTREKLASGRTRTNDHLYHRQAL